MKTWNKNCNNECCSSNNFFNVDCQKNITLYSYNFTSLMLKFTSFPYPPFNDYEIDYIDSNIIIEEFAAPSNIFVLEGGIDHTKYFSFPNKGVYKICIKNLDNKDEDLLQCIVINVE